MLGAWLSLLVDHLLATLISIGFLYGIVPLFACVSVCDFYCFSSHRRLMHLLWGIVCVELFTEPWNFESVEFAFRNGDFWLRNASFVCQQLSFLYTCMCVCWQHSRVVTLLLLLITCKFHRMSHAQHRNLKAFKWFASQPWLAMWRDVTSFSSSHAHTIKASHAATQFLLVVVAKVARSLSLLSLSRFYSLFSLHCALS